MLDKLGTFFIVSIASFFIPLGIAKRAKRSKSIRNVRECNANFDLSNIMDEEDKK